MNAPAQMNETRTANWMLVVQTIAEIRRAYFSAIPSPNSEHDGPRSALGYRPPAKETFTQIVISQALIERLMDSRTSGVCAFRRIRSAVPTTSGQSFRGIRSPEDRCRIGMILMSGAAAFVNFLGGVIGPAQ